MTTGSPHLPDDHPAVIEMQGLVDTLRELVHHHLPGERERFETLLVDFSARQAADD